MINIHNLYYMLSYAFTVLNKKGYQHIATEPFNNVADLYSAILVKGVSNQLKHGLQHEYIEQTGSLNVIRGKINVTTSIKHGDIMNKRLNCTYDEFSINTYMNQILKTTMLNMLKLDISRTRKKALKRLLIYFEQVEVLDYRRIDWQLRFNRHYETYRMLMAICYLVIQGQIQSERSGSRETMMFEDEQQMAHLYERFVRAYYKKEFPELKVTASHIPWALDDDNHQMLPTMRSDIMLTYGKQCLIIDTKYYTTTLQQYFDTRTIHSGNLYQIFAYVKNEALHLKSKQINVAGMLLYAKTNEYIVPDNTFQMSGNTISVKTLDLNQDFIHIAKQLDDIVYEYFGL
ncbi:5-methylcytosine-specific restriction enzyme subunit McrC [Staphylococcus hominis]